MGEIVKPIPGIVGDIHRERAFNRQIARAECGPSSVQPWMYDNSGCADYDEELGVLFGGSIEAFAKRRKEKNGSLVVMDLMGHGQVLRELPVNSGLAIALGDGRDDATRESDNVRNIEIICGDVLSKSTWEKTAEWVKKQGVEGIDIVLCRPVGGYSHLVDDPNILYCLISQVWGLLSQNNGILAAELKDFNFNASKPHLYAWGELLKASKVDFWKASTGVSFKKTPDSPTVLPKIDIK